MTLDHFRFVFGALDGTFIRGKAVSELLQPESVPPGVPAQQAEGAPTRVLFCAGAVLFVRAHITLTEGIFVGPIDDATEQAATRFEAVSGRQSETAPARGAAQGPIEIAKAMRARG